MIYLLPIPFSILAIITDIKERKINNKTTYSLLIIGIFINAYIYGLEGIKSSFSGCFTAIILLSVFGLFMRLGGGDTKLILAYSTFLGREKTLIFVLIFIVLSFIVSLVAFIRENGIKEFLKEIKMEIRNFGIYKTKFKRKIGAPILLGAYLFALFFTLGKFNLF